MGEARLAAGHSEVRKTKERFEIPGGLSCGVFSMLRLQEAAELVERRDERSRRALQC